MQIWAASDQVALARAARDRRRAHGLRSPPVGSPELSQLHYHKVSLANTGCLADIGSPNGQGPDLLLAGMTLVGFGGPGIQLSGIHVSNLFPEAKALVACFIVGALQLSFFVFAIFDVLYSYAGASMRQIFFTYAVVLVVALVVTIFTEPDSPFLDVTVSDPPPEHELLSPMRLPTVFKDEEASLLLSTPELQKKRKRRGRGRLPTDGFFFDGADLHHRSFRTQVFSAPFVLMTLYFSIQSLWCNFFLGSITAQLRWKALPDPTVGRLLGDLALVLPGSVVFIPIVGYLLETCGYIYASLLCTVVALTFTALLWLGQTSAGLLAAFATYAFFRTIMFPLLFAYLGHTFGFSHYGALSGVAFMVGGLVGLLQAPIARIGDFNTIAALQVRLAMCVHWRLIPATCSN